MSIAQNFSLYWVNVYYLPIGTVLGINTDSQIERCSVLILFRGMLNPGLYAIVCYISQERV